MTKKKAKKSQNKTPQKAKNDTILDDLEGLISMENKRGFFHVFAKKISIWSGSPSTFMLALAIVLIWVATGPIFDYSDTWQLVINTGTTIVTFLMVFLIQNSQNRDTAALQIKLDELIRATEGAHTALLDLEELSEKELTKICDRYEEIAKKSREQMRKGKKDTGIKEVHLSDIK